MKKVLKDIWHGIKATERGKFILLSTAIIIILFSGILFTKINNLNNWISKVCEPREYIDYNKEVRVPLDSNRRQEIINEIQKEKNKTTGSNSYSGLLRLLSPENHIEALENTLKEGEEIKYIPDEERRASSRKEVENYENCLKNQSLSKLDRPQKYNFIIIGNIIILIVGLLIFFALNRDKSD